MTESERNFPIRLRGTHAQPEASEILFTPGLGRGLTEVFGEADFLIRGRKL